MARIDCQGSALQSADGKTAEMAAKGAPEPAGMTTPEPADKATSKTVDMATAKPAAGPSDEITSNPASYMTASSAVASSAPSAPRRRDVRRRSGQGSRKGKDYDLVQYRTLGVSSRHRMVSWRTRSNWRAAGCSRSDWGFEGADANRCSGSLRAWPLTQSHQPPRELQRQIRDSVVSSHGSLLLRKRRYRRKKEIGS